jgi:hypothetical protein
MAPDSHWCLQQIQHSSRWVSGTQIGIDTAAIYDTIKNFRAPFGRAEELEINGKHVRILLSKNPVGMNETIRVVNELQKNRWASTKLLVLNDRRQMVQMFPGFGMLIPRSWWSQGEQSSSVAIAFMTWHCVYAIARLIGENNFNFIVKEDLQEAIATALEHTPANETLYILPTYSAMLEVRGIPDGSEDSLVLTFNLPTFNLQPCPAS